MYDEIRLGRGQESLKRLLVRGLLILAVLWIVLFLLPGCDDGEFERQQRIAEFSQRFVNACMPELKELKIIRWENGQLICYPLGTKRQPVVVTNKDYE